MQRTSAEKLLEILATLMRELHPDAALHRQITLDSRLDRDLGLDSLARMELLTRLEKEYALRLPEKILVTVETPRDLLRHLAGAAAVAERPAEAETGEQDPGSASRREIGMGGVQTLQEMLARHVRLQPEAEHIVVLEGDGEVRISYGLLHAEALKVAGLLQQLSLEPGESVAIMLPTGMDYFCCFFGVLYGGGVPVPLYPPTRPTQIEEHVRRHRRIIANAGAPILITGPEVKPVARLLMSQVPELRKIVTSDELYGAPALKIPFPHRQSDIAFLQYTSGSTGDPKGVILTHANLLANIRAMGQVCRVTAEDVFVSWLPLYHDMGLIGAWLGSLCHGCRLVVMPPLAFIARPERWLRAISRFGGTLSASPNFGYQLCATRLDESLLAGLDLGTWRLAFNGAEPVIPATMELFQQRFQGYGLRPGTLTPVYGLAESSVGLAFPSPGSGVRIDRIERDTFAASGRAVPAAENGSSPLAFVCCGRPLPGHQIRVVDKQDRELPERREGRLQFRGPSATGGYFRNSEQTRGLFRGEWLESGDLAYIAAGELYLTGRIKDIIIRGGRNIYPHELEEAVGNIPGIRRGSTAVFAGSGRSDGPEKLVVLTESRQRKESVLKELKQRITEVTGDLLGMGPDEVIIAPPGTVLKTSSGKIRRSACRELYESGHIGRSKPAVWLQLTRMGLASARPMLQRLAARLGDFFYAWYCWLVLGLFGTGVWVALMVLPAGRRCWNVAAKAVRTILKLVGLKVSVQGLENIPAEGGCLLVANHMSYLDSLILTGILPQPVNYVAKAELGRNPLLRVPMRKLGVFPVDRFDAEQGIADSNRIATGLRRGLRPLFFAEGTLQRMPGLLPFQMGAFLLASTERVPMVPVIIQGSRNILRGGSWFPRRGRVRIVIEPPLTVRGSGWQGAIDLRDRTRKIMLQRLEEPDLAGEITSLQELGLKRPGE